ncbi:MFS transporter [Actinomadura sp. NPDC049382]|uniref:MFS transporter n=1 Tax=Actinomadura sp. NPDC049382 TaxID=3158220 RepID=UPI003416ED57
MWSAAAGAVGGPLLLDPSGTLAGDAGLPSLTGPFLLAVLTCAIAAAAATGTPRGRSDALTPPVPVRRLIRTPAARSALTVMVTAQVVMVAVMTAAPLDMHLHGDGLDAVGMTLSAHTLGMFALSPVTGRLFDRFGARPVIVGGLLTLALSTALAAVATGSVGRPLALFLLGYGWNLCFVGGSGRLARDLPEADRPHVEGAVDAAVWTIAAAASLASTAVLSAGGYAALAWASCAAVLLITLVQIRR